MTNHKEILRLHSLGISGRGIAASLECSRNTVSNSLHKAQEHDLSWPLQKDLSNAELEKLYFPERIVTSDRKAPDYDYIHKELAKSGVTLSLLWHEYNEECRINREIPFMYTQFCKMYRSYASKTKATMRIHNKPGEKLEVDWAGKTASIIDNTTGEIIKAYVFVASLPYSSCAYVEAFLSMEMESWITAHVNAFKYFGGVTKILVPDNLKTGVDSISWYTPIINKTYHEMAEHYETVVIPARVRKPKDKPTAEGTVGVISTWIIAAIRKQQFFTLYELNTVIKEKLEEFNQKPFQKKEGCRRSVFDSEEKHTLIPLPATQYELSTWKIATVQFNYHISVDKMHYSVPYEYIKNKVDVRVTKNIIEVFYKTHRIASHIRLHGRPGQYHTLPEHMPENHKQYNEWNADRFISWAKDIGPNTEVVIKAILSSKRLEQQTYRACMALLKSADKYSMVRLEVACAKALTYTPKPNYKSVQTILKTGADKIVEESYIPSSKEPSDYGFTRGADYYGRDN
jgi:transposase